MQNLIKIYHVVQAMRASDHNLLDLSYTKPCHRFASLCLDNVKMFKYAKGVLTSVSMRGFSLNFAY